VTEHQRQKISAWAFLMLTPNNFGQCLNGQAVQKSLQDAAVEQAAGHESSDVRYWHKAGIGLSLTEPGLNRYHPRS
jgi:hypothetical protein